MDFFGSKQAQIEHLEGQLLNLSNLADERGEKLEAEITNSRELSEQLETATAKIAELETAHAAELAKIETEREDEKSKLGDLAETRAREILASEGTEPEPVEAKDDGGDIQTVSQKYATLSGEAKSKFYQEHKAELIAEDRNR